MRPTRFTFRVWQDKCRRPLPGRVPHVFIRTKPTRPGARLVGRRPLSKCVTPMVGKIVQIPTVVSSGFVKMCFSTRTFVETKRVPSPKTVESRIAVVETKKNLYAEFTPYVCQIPKKIIRQKFFKLKLSTAHMFTCQKFAGKKSWLNLIFFYLSDNNSVETVRQ